MFKLHLRLKGATVGLDV